ncbi:MULTISPECIES: GAF domain-containing protein [unclassified Arsukibacterium]|uniref:GAF domain-containing protein n=1 Tax=unclassified Arsukibacterium TaxID=2635278 RepID=UPI000C6747C3|nr:MULTISPECIES: GAF domain-containing protein [unclassified Arsukibacterium]MAA94020.1 GAF domain-containing protein [Rheinheimera sp.]MBM33393.1 GAF domain-containing protein [Rheinheimera sp.]HAW92542.1 GAF domain-containing protein [Candidatus Azambacteria bacterium]|tara:strand:+ start:797 stop:1270 length:474 start_codon:yes stop_codon:yes gene_type:complete
MSSEKNSQYGLLLQQAQALIADETDVIANMANLSALLYNSLPDLNWAGFYIMRNDELVLGPFQGQVACVRIPVGKGVCGTAVATGQVQLVEDVHQFAGHIACDSASNSEIVLPVRFQQKIIAVLDIDSPLLSRFDSCDQQHLETLVKLLEQRLTETQ